METEGKVRLADVLVGIRDPRQAKKVDHDLGELLMAAICGVLAGADDFVEIEEWAKAKLDWFRRYLVLEHGIPTHDTFGRVFAAINAEASAAAFRRWVSAVAPALDEDDVAGIDGKTSRRSGKTSRRSGKIERMPLHLVSAFAARANLVLGQRATAKKSNEKTAIPELLATLALEGCIVTIDAMGARLSIDQSIRDRGADYTLAVKDNQSRLAESMEDLFAAFEAAPDKTPHDFDEVLEKDHGRLEVCRCYACRQLDCLHAPEHWPGLESFAVITSERSSRGKTTLERRCYLGRLPADVARLNQAVRQHWRVDNSLHWCMDMSSADDQMPSHRQCSPQPRRDAPFCPQPHPPRPHPTQRRTHGVTTHRRRLDA